MNAYATLKQLDEILGKTTIALEDGKSDIFDLSEKAQKDIATIELEYVRTQGAIRKVIEEVDRLEAEEKTARADLARVSREFESFTENQVRAAYERTKNIQLKLSVKQQEEKELFMKRSSLEARLRDTKEVKDRADKLTAKVGTALEYLRNSVLEQIEDMKSKKDISMRIIQAQENERQRMAHDIHDGPAQSMANLVVKAEVCERLMDKDLDRAKRELQGLKGNLRNSLTSIRQIIYDLMPMSLDDLGLIPTIQRLVDDLEKNTHARVHFVVKNEENDLQDPMIIRTVFRIIQEGLNNIQKHADCERVDLTLRIDKSAVNVRLRDDGVGFDPSVRPKFSADSGGFGLYSIKERVDLLEGEFSINSKVGEGTILTASIPLINGEVQ